MADVDTLGLVIAMARALYESPEHVRVEARYDPADEDNEAPESWTVVVLHAEDGGVLCDRDDSTRKWVGRSETSAAHALSLLCEVLAGHLAERHERDAALLATARQVAT